jgi:hypothetical protein
LKEWTTPDFRNTPSTTNLEGEEIVDAPGKDGNASMPEQVNRPNPCRKMMIMMMIIFHYVEIKSLTKHEKITQISPLTESNWVGKSLMQYKMN